MVTEPSVEGRRAAFEKFIRPQYSVECLRRRSTSQGTPYADLGVQRDWEIWQACDESHRELRECLLDVTDVLDKVLDVCVYNTKLGWDTTVRNAESAKTRASKILEEKS